MVSGELDFVVATEGDLDALHLLYSQLGSGSKALERERLAEAFRSVSANGLATVWLVQRDRVVIGTFILMILPALGDRCRPLAVVEDVVVDEGARGGGVGRAMMEFVMARAREADCYKLMLSSNLRRTEAHAFYESLGFARHGYSFQVDL
jgi:GNAT superfamily N-acetyltransferase